MLLSVPVSVTCVSFAAITVKVDEFPEVIEAGLAVMLTVGARDATFIVVAAETFPPAPVAIAV